MNEINISHPQSMKTVFGAGLSGRGIRFTGVSVCRVGYSYKPTSLVMGAICGVGCKLTHAVPPGLSP